jgi:two-component system, sensor histidine kinase YesM
MIQKLNQTKNKIFHRILFTYSIIILLFMFLLFSVLANYYTEVVVQRELDANTRTLEKVEAFFNRKQDYVDSVFKELYMKTDLIQDFSFALQHDYDQYLSYRLDKYSESRSFVPSNIESFIQMYFMQDSDANAVSISSDSTQVEYLFIFNHYRWSQSVKETSEMEQNHKLLQAEEFSGNWTKPLNKKIMMKDNFVISRSLNDPGTLKKLGDMTVYYDFEGIDYLLNLRKQQLKGTIYVYNRFGKLLYSSTDKGLQKKIKLPRFQTSLNISQLNGEKYYVNTLADERTQLMIVGVIPVSEIEETIIVHRTMLLFTIVFAFTAIIIIYFTMRKYSKRIQIIEQSMKEVQRGNLNVRIPKSDQNDELSLISNCFNKMLDDLNQYIDKVYISEIKQKDAEMKALQSQINPHFLYNTLEAIRMKAIADGSKTTGEMIFNLAQLFRYSLKDKDFVLVEDEVQYVKQYIQLFQIRYPNRLHVTYDIPENCYRYRILKFTLQPIVENYIIHGFRKNDWNNQLYIGIKEKDECLHIIVRDNGNGIQEDRLLIIQEMLKNRCRSNDSIGLFNVNQRIRLKYGSEYGITVQSIEGTETVVEIVIPVQKKGGDI